MISGVDKLNLIFCGVGLGIALIGLVKSIISVTVDQKVKLFVVVTFITLTAYILSNLICQISLWYSSAGWRTVAYVSLFCESFFSVLLLPILTGMLIYFSGETDWRHNLIFRIVSVLWLIYLGLLIFTQFSTVIYSIDEQNVYHRGALYPLLLVPPMLIMLADLVALLRCKDRLSLYERRAFALYIILPTLCMGIQMLHLGLYVIALGVSVAAFILLFYVINDQTAKYHRIMESNAQLSSKIMLSQIQPHFLLNTLSAVRSIYRSDPQKGEHTLGLFTAYLRHNMDSLTIDQPICFEKELEHVQHYLELQMLRFGSDLKVDYRINCTGFCLPTLTLQPLVENAVTHGIRRSESGMGTVVICSEEFFDHYEVSVTDDGPGFVYSAIAADSGHSHVGISNVRERLQRVSGGSLQIVSEPGHGTTATIILPKEDRTCWFLL